MGHGIAVRWLLWALTALFAARVAGQAVQRWAPVPWLPPQEAFQGSNLSYAALLSTQLAILAVMAFASWRVFPGRMAASPRLAHWLAWSGGLYMAIALGRIAVGLLAPQAPAWFRAWVPAAFHVVLAAFVIALCVYHSRKPRRG